MKIKTTNTLKQSRLISTPNKTTNLTCYYRRLTMIVNRRLHKC